jgi:hypothetical protein
MSPVVIETKPTTTPVRHPFTGGARWAAAAVLVTGPVRQVVEFLFENLADDNAARVAWWLAHPALITGSQIAGLLAGS